MKVLVVHTFNQSQKGNDSIVINEIELLRSYGLAVELLRIPLTRGSKLSVILKTVFNYSSLQQVKNKISAFKPDIVHLHCLEYGSLAAAVYAAKRFGLPLVHTPHDYSLLCPSGTLFYQDSLYADSVHQIFPYKTIRKALYLKSRVLTFTLSVSMLLHYLLGTWKKIDSIIVSAEAVKRIFADSKLSTLSGRIAVISSFCYPSGAERHGPVRAPYYLYAGALTDESGIPVLLESFADNGLALKVAGKGKLSKLVYGYSEFYPNISLIATDDPDEITWLFENASALIFPSVWYEPFASMVVKAFSMGLPVIASDRGILSGMITQGFDGMLFEAGNDKDLGEKVRQFTSLKWSESKKYRENVLQTYHHRFTPERAAGELKALYDSLYHRQNSR